MASTSLPSIPLITDAVLTMSPNTVTAVDEINNNNNNNNNNREGKATTATKSSSSSSKQKQHLGLHPSALELSIHSATSVTVSSEDDYSIGCGSNSFDASFRTTDRRRVRFSPLVRVRDTLSRREMTLKEHYSYWLQEHEFLMIKQRNQRTIQFFEHGLRQQGLAEEQQEEDASQSSSSDVANNNNNNAEDDPVATNTNNNCHCPTLRDDEDPGCLRGLEAGLSHENLRRRSYRFASLEEVFQEQDNQYYDGIYDDIAIAEVYYEVTVECRFRAQYRALQDRKEIVEYLASNEE